MILSFIGETGGTDVEIPLCEGIEIDIKKRGGPNGRGHGGMALISWLLTGIDIETVKWRVRFSTQSMTAVHPRTSNLNTSN